MGLGCFIRFAEFILVQVAASQRRRSFFLALLLLRWDLGGHFLFLLKAYVLHQVVLLESTIDFDWILKQHHGLTA
jgi:hypothetical protein